MINHLKTLKNIVECHFTSSNIFRIKCESTDTKIIRDLLAKGNKNFKGDIIGAINDLVEELTEISKANINEFKDSTPENKSVSKIYKDLIDHYNETRSIPSIFYVITDEKSNPYYPIRVASWFDNWNKVKNEVRKKYT